MEYNRVRDSKIENEISTGVFFHLFRIVFKSLKDLILGRDQILAVKPTTFVGRLEKE